MDFQLFNLAALIGETIGVCENDESPITQRLPHMMITAHNGYKIEVSAWMGNNIVLYNLRITASNGGIVKQEFELSNYELLKAVYSFFTGNIE